MSVLVHFLIVFFLLLILLNISHKVFGYSFGLFSVIEGNKGFQEYDDDPLTMANEQKTKIEKLKKRVDETKEYHDKFEKIKSKFDDNDESIKGLS